MLSVIGRRGSAIEMRIVCRAAASIASKRDGVNPYYDAMRLPCRGVAFRLRHVLCLLYTLSELELAGVKPWNKRPMKRLFLSLFLCLCATVCRAAETLATSAATLELDSPACEFAPQLFTPDWQGYRASGGLVREADGSYAFKIETKSAGTIRGKAVFKPLTNGALAAAYTFTPVTNSAVEAVYTFTPERDITLNALYVGTSLPTDHWAGGGFQAMTGRPDGHGRLPVRYMGLNVFTSPVSSLSLFPPSSRERLTFLFPEPTTVMIQDDRQWGPTFSVRIGCLNTKTFKAGEPFTVRFTLATHEPQRLTLDAPVTIQAGADWIPLKDESDILPGSMLDFSALGFVDAPAGKYGRVIAKGPHFEFERKPGVAQRFYGVNLCFTANFLDSEQSARLAGRLARTGYNAVRIHHYDGGLVDGSKDGTTLNPDKLARLDALMAACVTNGLYVTTDLFVSRPVPWRSVGIDRDGTIPMNDYKILVPVHEGAWENFKTFTRQLLTHVNPFTGRRYADEPALAWLSMINEGNFGNYLAEMRNIPEWQQAWQGWLAKRQAQEPQLYAGVPATLPDSIYGTSRHVTAFVLFLQETETLMITRMKAFLRDDLACRALITNRNAWTNHASDQVTREELYDYVDDHFYVDHPEFIERPWQLPSKCANVNPLKNAAMGVQNVVFTRLLDKPFTITEYNYAAPGRFRGVGGILTGALGALQDWGGIWRFAYGHNAETVTRAEGTALDYFDMAADPLSQAAERATLCLFLRGDLVPLKRSYALVLPKGDLLRMRDAMPHNRTDWPWLAWYARLGTQVSDSAPGGVTWSGRFPEVYGVSSGDARELLVADPAMPLPHAGDGAVTIDNVSGTFVLDTPRTSGGFAESGMVDAGALIFDVGGTPATVWVSALDGNPIKSSSRLLLTHLTDVQNSGTRYAQQTRKTLLAWGGLPHLVRNGTAEIRLAVKPAKDYKVYVLSTSGRRLAAVPCRVVKGRLAFAAVVDGQSGSAAMLYEVVKE